MNNKCSYCSSFLDHPLKKWCSRQCRLSGGRKSSRDKICVQCNSPFHDKDQGNRKKVCSKKCYDLDLRLRSYKHLHNIKDVKNALIYRTNCDICKKEFNIKGEPTIDHCHDTNTFRGLLCRNCNTGLGLFKNHSNLNNAIQYLLKDETKSPKFEISRIMAKAYNRGWITSKDGNASIVEKTNFYITPSGVTKYNIDPDSIIVGLIENGQISVNSEVKPSGEFLMHAAMYSLPGVKAVLHLHPTYIIAALHRGFNLQDFENQFPEINRFMKVGYNVPTIPPVSKELADATKTALYSDGVKYDIVGQTAHGVCAIGETLQQCFDNIERLEHICQIVLASGVNP